MLGWCIKEWDIRIWLPELPGKEDVLQDGVSKLISRSFWGCHLPFVFRRQEMHTGALQQSFKVNDRMIAVS